MLCARNTYVPLHNMVAQTFLVALRLRFIIFAPEVQERGLLLARFPNHAQTQLEAPSLVSPLSIDI